MELNTGSNVFCSGSAAGARRSGGRPQANAEYSPALELRRDQLSPPAHLTERHTPWPHPHTRHVLETACYAARRYSDGNAVLYKLLTQYTVYHALVPALQLLGPSCPQPQLRVSIPPRGPGEHHDTDRSNDRSACNPELQSSQTTHLCRLSPRSTAIACTPVLFVLSDEPCLSPGLTLVYAYAHRITKARTRT